MYVLAISVLLAMVSCTSNGQIFQDNNGGPIVPPPGNNPGGTTNPLTAQINLSTDIGHAPLPVNMFGLVSGGAAPFTYRWDVNGDGFFEHGGVGVSEIGINYASFGTYTIVLEVVDNGGQSFITSAQVDVKPSGPIPQPTAFPSQGNAPLMVALDGSTSTDPDGSIVLYEWDFESDGIWDYESATNSSTTNTYNQGTYNATLRVTDDDGFESEASVLIVAL
jgi:PKD repeat protein